ncbi:MAG: MerR family transcriptional regulator [Bacteroidaceae bacterium]|nr:MerR family transcriptional regulator [Bacteroidaceae bacterium]
MAFSTKKDLKKYYSIGEVARMFDVAESLLRYWETEFPTIKPRKSGRNIRQYSADDIEQIRVVHNLVKVRGMKLAAARETLQQGHGKAKNSVDVFEKLQKIRAELVALRKELDHAAL